MSEKFPPSRPDDRPVDEVWRLFEAAFQREEFPNVSWALGSDWGMGSRILTPTEYRIGAYSRMAYLYGANPNGAP